MSFARRYTLWLVAPPAAANIPFALLFLSQVVGLTLTEGLGLTLLLIALSAMAGIAFATLVEPHAAGLDSGATTDVSDAMTRVLERTRTVAIAFWIAAGLLFAGLGSLWILPSFRGLSYFLVAAMIVAFPSIVWAYAAGKRRLVDLGEELPVKPRYSGRPLTLGRKIAIVFIGSFLVSSVALVQLVSSKVSTTLEGLAIRSSADRFQRVFDSASLMATVDADSIDTLRSYIPNEYAIHLIRPDGTVLEKGAPLDAEEVAAVRRIGNGDSSAFISSHVTRFAPLRDGSILVLSIPWEPYRNIPIQITFYTLLIAIVTTAIFTIATLLLARDVTKPLKQLRSMASEMASGNFDSSNQVFSDDEVGQLAKSFAETRANLSGLLGRVGGSGSTITDGVRVITGGTESLMTRSRNQAELTENSSAAVENVRAGIRQVLAAAQTVSILTEDASSRSLQLQSSAEEVASSMDHLFQSVEKTSSSTTEMNAAMNEMSQRADVLGGISDEVLSFVAELDAMVKELRSSSHATAEISRKVREDAEAGGAAVNRTLEGISITQELTDGTARVMGDLQGSVGQIGQIVVVIEEITNRTNLLALNAAIIAAQAGEHGTGFSVVADEIRELAERTRGSTKEIATIIKAVQTGSRNAVARINEGVVRVRETVDLAHGAASSLQKIGGSANQSHEMATRISRGLEEQGKASRHLHEVTSKMSDHIGEITRATREQARGTQLLAEEAERVRDIAGQVKTATSEQSTAGHGITAALEKIADDARGMRDLLERQLRETDRIADASRVMLSIAQQNDAIAREFNDTVQSLVRSGQAFQSEVARFRIAT